jgi:hypothetical protein
MMDQRIRCETAEVIASDASTWGSICGLWHYLVLLNMEGTFNALLW